MRAPEQHAGTIGDCLSSVIYCWESSLSAQQAIERVPDNYAMVSASTPGMSAADRLSTVTLNLQV